MGVSENMRNRRKALGITIAGLAQALGKHERQITKWETEVVPPTTMLQPIAGALHFSVAELLGILPTGLDLSGVWNAVWRTTRDGLPVLNKHQINARHAGEWVYLDADGDYDWRADMRVQNSVLAGTYQAVDATRNERGAMCLTLGPNGDGAVGHWTGAWADGINGVGFGVIARDAQRADRLMKRLIDQDTPMIKEWPA